MRLEMKLYAQPSRLLRRPLQSASQSRRRPEQTSKNAVNISLAGSNAVAKRSIISEELSWHSLDTPEYCTTTLGRSTPTRSKRSCTQQSKFRTSARQTHTKKCPFVNHEIREMGCRWHYRRNEQQAEQYNSRTRSNLALWWLYIQPVVSRRLDDRPHLARRYSWIQEGTR